MLIGSFICLLCLLNLRVTYSRNDTASSSREDKFLSVFTVVKFPNDPCGSTSGLNGTCYTNSQCESLGGSASGSCASSFGVCCVFSLSCGGSSSQNNTYATVTSYTVSSDPDPCTYTFCKSSSDVCKLRIDYETMSIGKGSIFGSDRSSRSHSVQKHMGEEPKNSFYGGPGGPLYSKLTTRHQRLRDYLVILSLIYPPFKS